MRTVDPVKKELRRAQILEAAAACFSRKGFQGASTNDICATVGMSPGNLFHYFPSKKALILAVVSQQGDQVRSLLDQLSGAPDPRHALETLFDVLFGVASDPDARRLVLETAAEAARDQEVQLICQKDDDALRAGILSLLDAARPARAAGSPDAAPVAQFLMSLVDGVFSRTAMDRHFDVSQVRLTLQWLLDKLFEMQPSQ